MRRLAFAMCFAVGLGCGHDGPSGPTGPDAAEFNGEKLTLSWGPVTVPAHVEGTQCVTLRLGNAAPVMVHQLHNKLGDGSHHLIVYKDDHDTDEVTTPTNCNPFTGAANATGMVAPMMITQKKDDLLRLPVGVAYSLGANQMIRIEQHYINTTDAPIQATATVEFDIAADGSVTDEADILFIGSPDIAIDGNGSQTLHEFFRPDIANLDLSTAKFFAITGHEHHYGTGVQVQVGESAQGPMTPVYDPKPFSWSEPETTRFDPPFTVPDGGGFDFTCSYQNTDSAPVGFGESANDEMCFFWAYYYPSKGSHLCVHTNYMGLNVDICCPEAGSSLCDRLNG